MHQYLSAILHLVTLSVQVIIHGYNSKKLVENDSLMMKPIFCCIQLQIF